MRMLENLLFSLSRQEMLVTMCFLCMVSLERMLSSSVNCADFSPKVPLDGKTAWIEITKMLANYVLSLILQITQKARLPNH